MQKKLIILPILTLALTTLACSVNINIPVTNITTDETVTEEIRINKPDPSAEITDLTINFGLGELSISPGAETALVTGTATYNIKDLKPKITTEGNRVILETGELEITGIPKFDKAEKNEWDLELGDMPLAINLNAGAYSGDLELGGLSIKSLNIMDGASTVKLKFTEPNPIEMDMFEYQTGASSVKLYGLANANFSEMVFKSGAGDYTLEFSGELLRDATVTINSGMSSLIVVVPEDTSARIFFDSGLSNIDIHGDWQKNGNMYTLSGGSPMLTININMAAGNLTLKN
ncbi:MAG: hypothetical protein JW908_05490 [Anaerolineales bacterium]|nr:hypothetical protein [Anaerolineales bacterium]